ncbi:hypothetical protein CHF27_009805 [Romboutsia maritimum]|uniref:DUF3221 domain-containing protein n=1 Tax=Romboutsia maritimum TaxID=2020948 RepID=A0A371IRL5_9FIRM|nr:hypothetical protein [Romboutsia maritimum]RDY23128.1 hypothetical protein CHF27_009805 [Romboutsia maritimum]
MKCCSYKKGIIVEINKDISDEFIFITIAEDVNNIYTFVRLVYSNATIILDCEYNEISVEQLDLGDTVFVYHSNIMTMSIPPQTQAYIIEVK